MAVALKVSLVTAVLNRAGTIADTLQSILDQTYPDIECIIVDGESTDGTLDVIERFRPRFGERLKVISEPDAGLYDAMNKGIRAASGDIVGFINSDDYYHDPTSIARIAFEFQNDRTIDAVYGDVHFVAANDPKRITRYYSSRAFRLSRFRYGFMPAHPTFFTYRANYERFGYFKADYRISGDFELLLRFLMVNKLKARYINADLLTMRAGGISTASLRNTLLLNREVMRACRENHIHTTYFHLYLRYFNKIFQFKWSALLHS